MNPSSSTSMCKTVPYGVWISPNESGVWAKEKATRPAGRNPTSRVSRSRSRIDRREQEIRFQHVRNSEIPRFDTDPAGIDLLKCGSAILAGRPSLAPTTSGPSLRLLNVYRREGQLRVTPPNELVSLAARNQNRRFCAAPVVAGELILTCGCSHGTG